MWPNVTFVFIFDYTLSTIRVRPPQLVVEAPAAAPAVLVKASRCCVNVLQSSVYWKVWKSKCFSMLFSDLIGMEWIVGIKGPTYMRMIVRISCTHYSVDRRDNSWWLFSSLQFFYFFFFLAVKNLKTIHHFVRCSQIILFLWCFHLTCKNFAAAAHENPLYEAKIVEVVDKKKKKRSEAKLAAG